MKFIGVFNSLPDILFVWYDEAFMQHLKKKLHSNGLPEDFSLEEEGTRLNFISQFFSPLIASQKYMTNIGDPFSSVVCENGSMVAIQNYDDFYYVSLCGDSEESEWFLHKKISSLQYLINMLYGSAVDQLKPALTNLRQQRWQLLASLLETWQILCQQEQIFLVESLERLHVNHVLNTICLNLLGEVLSKANKEGHAVHSLLLVNNKLLGLYSSQNAPELQTSDILMLTVFVKEKFEYDDKMVPCSLNRTPSQLMSWKTMAEDTACDFQRESIQSSPIQLQDPVEKSKSKLNESPSSYVSATSTPFMNQMSSIQEGYHTPQGGSPSLLDEFPQGDSPCDEGPNSTDADDSSGSNFSTPFSTPSLVDAPSAPPNEEAKINENETYQLSLFLKTANSSYTPHTIDFIKLDSATVLITISESKLVGFSLTISLIIEALTILQNKGSQSGQTENFFYVKSFEKLDSLFKKLVDGIFSNHELQYKWLIDRAVLLKKQWENLKKNGLKLHLESGENNELPPQMEASVSDIKKLMKAIFAYIFINERKPKPGRQEKHLKVVSNIKEIATSKLSYFSSYLQVRGQRNGTMTAYNNDFPGLVHFIYVNRTTNQLIAPTINQQSQTSVKSIPHVIKQCVWEMWQYAESHVAQGYASFIIKHEDFTYSYFLWFEDAMGKPLPVQRLPKAEHGNKLTGVISGKFYTDLIRQCFPNLALDAVHCYELFCVHIGIVSNRFIATSAKKLASQLWEASGEASSPIGLL